MLAGDIPGSTATGTYTGSLEARIKGYASTTALKYMMGESVYASSNLTGVAAVLGHRRGKWRTVSTTITRLDFGCLGSTLPADVSSSMESPNAVEPGSPNRSIAGLRSRSA